MNEIRCALASVVAPLFVMGIFNLVRQVIVICRKCFFFFFFLHRTVSFTIKIINKVRNETEIKETALNKKVTDLCSVQIMLFFSVCRNGRLGCRCPN